jgi:penicillin amidase
MMRAHDWESFREGMKGYVAPAANLVFADASGNIGYQALVSTPKRRGYESLPKKGWTGEDEWNMVPFEDMPSMVNPESHSIFSANHLPIGSWYPYLVSTSKGEGPRSWRLRELLAGDEKLSVDDFHQKTHLDATNPGVRDFIKLATLVIREGDNLKPRLEQAVTTLENWDGRLATDEPAYPIARTVLDILLRETNEGTSTFAQFGGEWAQYAGSWNGLNRLLKDLMAEYEKTNVAPRDREVRRWLRSNLRAAIRESRQSEEHQPPITHRMPYQDNMGRWGSVVPQYDLVSPPLTCPVTQTIWSQAGETYVQIVDLSDIDNSRALLPPGNSEEPHSPHADDQVPMWVAGEMHPAPLTREGVFAVMKSVKHLTWRR